MVRILWYIQYSTVPWNSQNVREVCSGLDNDSHRIPRALIIGTLSRSSIADSERIRPSGSDVSLLSALRRARARTAAYPRIARRGMATERILHSCLRLVGDAGHAG